jgi:hypothetical protein
MPNLRPAASAAVALLVSFASSGLAQGRILDEGTFLVTRTGLPQATEGFKIWRLEDGALLATGALIAGPQRITSSLRTDSLGTPIAYSVTVRDGGGVRDSLVAAARGTRLQSHTQAHGDESMREYQLMSGTTLILEDDLVHELYFAVLARRSGAVRVISPRAARGSSATISAMGLEPIEVGGRSVTAAHYSLNGGSGRRDFWVDSAGRLLRVDGPGAGLRAVREELPR